VLLLGCAFRFSPLLRRRCCAIYFSARMEAALVVLFAPAALIAASALGLHQVRYYAQRG
jgi:hypothetical protein